MTNREQLNVYLERINHVSDYVTENLTGDLSLQTLASEAGFSPYHFHRIFKEISGETLNSFVVRMRLARAVALLKAEPDRRLRDVAVACGFQSASNFSRTFKRRYGISPGQWDRTNETENARIGVASDAHHPYTLEALAAVEDSEAFSVDVRPFPRRRLAYIRVYNAYAEGKLLAAHDRLMAWANANRLNVALQTLIGMSQDDPDVVPLEQCRYDICLTIDDGVQPDNGISTRSFPACRLAIVHCKGDIARLDRAWQYLYRYWLPRSRYAPDNLPALEIYRQKPIDIGWEMFDIECAVPVTRLASGTATVRL